MEKIYDLLKSVFLLAVGAIFSFVAQQFLWGKQTEVQEIDYRITHDSGFLAKPDFPNKKIEILVDGVEKPSLSQSQVSILNYSEKDYKEFPLYIKISPKKDEKINILGSYVVGQSDLPKLVEEIKNENDSKNNSFIYSYNIKSLTRAEKNEYGFKSVYIFEGNVEPKIEVIPTKEGVRAREFELEHSPFIKKRNIKVYIGLVVFVFLLFFSLFFIITPIMNFIFRPFERKTEKNIAKKHSVALSKHPLLSQLSQDDIKKISIDTLFTQKKENWEKRGIIGRWTFFGFIEPKKQDYEFE